MNGYRIALALLLLLAVATACTSQPTPSTPTPSLTAPTATLVPSISTPVDTPVPTATSMPEPTGSPVPTVALPTAVPTVPPNAAAVVNGQVIPLQDYEDQVNQAVSYLKQQQSFDASTLEGQAALAQVQNQVLSWMVDQALIEQAAAKAGITVADDKVDAEISQLIGDDAAKFDEWLKANGLTQDTFRIQLRRELLSAALQERVVGSMSTTVEQAHVRHILLASEAEAMDVLLQLRSGGDFAGLARQYSQDKATSETGGDLGFFPRGVMPIEIEAVAFALNPGQMSGIVKTDFGYHIIEVVERDPARVVADEMLATWRQQSFLRWLEAEKSIAKIQYGIQLD
jgi:parvulin-like peptidyl-prolyl isomerase